MCGSSARLTRRAPVPYEEGGNESPDPLAGWGKGTMRLITSFSLSVSRFCDSGKSLFSGTLSRKPMCSEREPPRRELHDVTSTADEGISLVFGTRLGYWPRR